MSAESEAYRFAQGLITEATVNRAEELSFDRPETHALERLPPEIRFLDGLRSLDLRNTQLTDISVLRELGGLTTLLLDDTQVSDLSPLAGLTALTTLWLNDTQVSDLSPLLGQTALDTLSLKNTQVSDLSPLLGLRTLTTLRLENTQVSDLSPLAGLTGITTLFLSDTQVSDLSPLAGLTGITTLFLNDTQVSDLSPLAGLTGITTLFLSGTQVSNLSPLAKLTGITKLALTETQVSDLSPLAGMTGLETLFLGAIQISDLSPLGELNGITELWLTATQVSDLSPLAGMNGIVTLALDRTPVLDLRVLAKLEKLAEGGEDRGLTFTRTAATNADPRIAEISEIEDNGERVRTLFDYLEGWEPPSNAQGLRPPPDDLLPILTDDGRLEVSQSLPTEAERDERLKAVLHERMRTKANDLAQAAGNRFPRLAARARAVVAQVDRPFAEVDLLLLHLEVEDLSAREMAGSEDGDPFPPEVTGPLSDVLRIGPGLTLGHPDVDKLNERINSARSQPVPVDEKSAHDTMSHATAADDAAIGDRLRALEGRISQLPAEVALVVQRATHRNMLWRIAVGGALFSAGLAEGVGVNVASTLFHTQIVTFVQTNWPILIKVASTYGSAFAEWFAMSVGSVPDLAALSRNTLDRLRDQTAGKK